MDFDAASRARLPGSSRVVPGQEGPVLDGRPASSTLEHPTLWQQEQGGGGLELTFAHAAPGLLASGDPVTGLGDLTHVPVPAELEWGRFSMRFVTTLAARIGQAPSDYLVGQGSASFLPCFGEDGRIGLVDGLVDERVVRVQSTPHGPVVGHLVPGPDGELVLDGARPLQAKEVAQLEEALRGALAGVLAQPPSSDARQTAELVLRELKRPRQATEGALPSHPVSPTAPLPPLELSRLQVARLERLGSPQQFCWVAEGWVDGRFVQVRALPEGLEVGGYVPHPAGGTVLEGLRPLSPEEATGALWAVGARFPPVALLGLAPDDPTRALVHRVVEDLGKKGRFGAQGRYPPLEEQQALVLAGRLHDVPRPPAEGAGHPLAEDLVSLMLCADPGVDAPLMLRLRNGRFARALGIELGGGRPLGFVDLARVALKAGYEVEARMDLSAPPDPSTADGVQVQPALSVEELRQRVQFGPVLVALVLDPAEGRPPANQALAEVNTRLQQGEWLIAGAVVEGFACDASGTEYVVVKPAGNSGSRLWRLDDFAASWASCLRPSLSL